MENKKDSIVICPGAQVLGDVELGENVSIWMFLFGMVLS